MCCFLKASAGNLPSIFRARKRTRLPTYSNRLQPYSTRRIWQIIKQYTIEAKIEKRVYPHLFRHQLITYLTKKGMISPKLQLLSGHSEEKSLAIYRDLALSDVAAEYEEAMQAFPVR
jgi:integrase/recombinase XerD